MPFTPLPEHALARLDDDALVAHLRAARAAGAGEQASLALRLLVFGHWDRVRRRVALKVAPADVDAVASDVLWSAIRASFEGRSAGAFTAWLNTITRRRIADYHRRRADAPAMVAIAAGGEPPAAEAATVVDPPDRSQEGLVETQDVIDRALAQLSELHARVVRRHVLDGLPARETGDELGLGADNVAQIASRFRRRLRAALEEAQAR